MIDHVHNQSNKKFFHKQPNTADDQLIKRVSRYQQHCQSLSKTEKEVKKSLSPQSRNKNSDASHMAVLLKNSLSSSRESTPTLIKLSRSATPTPLLQSVKHTDDKSSNQSSVSSSKSVTRAPIYNKVTLVSSSENAPPPPPTSMPPHSASTISSSLSTRLPLKPSASAKEPTTNVSEKTHKKTGSLKLASPRKTVAFIDAPTVLTEPAVSRKLSLGRFTSKSEYNSESPKARRKSLTNYLSDKAVLVTRASWIFNFKQNSQLKVSEPKGTKAESVAVGLDKKELTSHAVSPIIGKHREFYEPEPDYWDVAENGEGNKELKKDLSKQKSAEATSSIKQGHVHIKKAVSLAEIIVQSISANNSNKSSLSSTSSSKAKQKKEKDSLETLLTPILQSNTNTLESTKSHKEKNTFFYKSLTDFEQENNSGGAPHSPIIPLIDYDLTTRNDLSNQSDSNYSSNIYNSLDEENKKQTSHFVSSLNTSGAVGGSSSAIYSIDEFELELSNPGANKKVNDNNLAMPSLPPPPPPPPMPSTGFGKNSEPHLDSSLSMTSSSSSASLALRSVPISIDAEALLVARQNLKMQQQQQQSISLKSSDTDETKKNEKSEFLLKEIQNHRLYNTKKDYVLDFLERSSERVRSNKNATTSNANIKPCIVVITNKSENVNTKAAVSPTVSSTSLVSTTRTNDKSSNYERFPFARNKQSQQPTHKYSLTHNAVAFNTKRIQSNSCHAENRTTVGEHLLTQPDAQKMFANTKSVSVDRINQIENASLNRKFATSTSNQILQINVSQEDHMNKKMSTSVSNLLINYEQIAHKTASASKSIHQLKTSKKVSRTCLF